MKLYGNFLSPYVRRVAIAMRNMGLPYEMENFLVFAEPEKLGGKNPLTRIPMLELDDGEVLVESTAILDALDEIAGPDKALTPPAGAERRKILKIMAIATGATEGAQWAFYEIRFHPEEKQHQPWIERNEARALSALAWLEERAAEAGGGWLDGSGKMTNADIAAAVALSFVKKVRPNLKLDGRFPALEAFTARLEATDAFKAAPLPS